MKNTELALAIKGQFSIQTTITSKELVLFLSSLFPDLSTNTISWKINQLKTENLIYQAGRGLYTFDFKPDFNSEITLKTKRLYNKTKSFVSSELVVWDTEMLDLIVERENEKRTTFLLVQKDGLNELFEQMQSMSKPVFLEPNNETIQRYILPQNDVILLYPLISETPTQHNGDYAVLTLEGILVNAWLLSENYLKSLNYSIEEIFESAFKKYNVNKNKLLRYAARRDQRKEIEEHIQNINND
ncbi:DUF6577 family protein [Flavobacterium gawalongense]|uniref:Uncharacterized protein n=1 Tax=Flavobacterium gawalongense TaxID=2594432 RepID=A0A553BC46_9FLAO|nr:DUF6577 family protein [Flavobacterium gawalongense]TRX05823.1 hypothetical protein FNW11_15475 [Flavobacterium gawalongense]TRX06752.1 hypothetical protein FNW10_15435 [Flavobacterium gawalongense]TRX22487.1 hypothetical protein FNW38_15685 [Flavobacterium gawalongense]